MTLGGGSGLPSPPAVLLGGRAGPGGIGAITVVEGPKVLRGNSENSLASRWSGTSKRRQSYRQRSIGLSERSRKGERQSHTVGMHIQAV